MAKPKDQKDPQDKPAAKGSEKKEKTAKVTKAAKAAPKAGEEAKAAAPKGSKKPAAPRRPLTPRTFFADQGKLSGWTLVDATGLPLGRVSSRIAQILMGKDKAGYTAFHDTGDSVVVINASKVVLTGNKWADKRYYYHTNFPGGIKTFTAQELRDKHPERLIERAVWGMLPKGHMGRRWIRKLRVFPGADHTHTAQQPKAAKLPDLGNWEK